MISQKIKINILLGCGMLSLLIFLFPAIPQSAAYHDFADARVFYTVPNFLNVLSNLPFAIIGLWGIIYLLKHATQFKSQERLMFSFLFSGIFLVCFGSAYYHYQPNNITLVWDRLPMTIVFMSFFVLIISRYVNERAGFILLFPLLIIGVSSVYYWYYTEQQGRGDLRLYAWVQFFPALIIPVILILFRDKKGFNKELVWIAFWYVIAKVLEHFDKEIYSLLHVVSGHSLKHLAAAVSTYYMFVVMRNISTR